MLEALQSWPSALWGTVFILGLSPLLGFALSAIPLDERTFANGLALFAAMPTTISSCAVLTGQAKGNVALALLFSVVTNVLATVTAPFWLQATLVDVTDDSGGQQDAAANSTANGTGTGAGSDEEGQASIDAGALLLRLLLTIFLPVVVGKLLQFIPGVPALVKALKPYIKVGSSVLLVLIPWVKVSQAEEDFKAVSAADLVYVALLGITLHLVMLVLNYAAVATWLPAKAPERKAVVLCASQKTLGTAVAVIEALGETAAGPPGLLVIPCILSHFVQIILDALIAVRMAGMPQWPQAGGEDEDEDNEEEDEKEGKADQRQQSEGSEMTGVDEALEGSQNGGSGEGRRDLPNGAAGSGLHQSSS